MKLYYLYVIVLFCVASGCSTKPPTNYGLLDLVEVSGVVSLDGKPLSNAVVTFDDADGSFSFGMTDKSGKYFLRLDSEATGCRPGSKTVRISTSRKLLGLNSSEEQGEGGTSEGEERSSRKSDREVVPARYHKQSELRAEVSSSNRVFNFELKSDPQSVSQAP